MSNSSFSFETLDFVYQTLMASILEPELTIDTSDCLTVNVAQGSTGNSPKTPFSNQKSINSHQLNWAESDPFQSMIWLTPPATPPAKRILGPCAQLDFNPDFNGNCHAKSPKLNCLTGELKKNPFDPNSHGGRFSEGPSGRAEKERGKLNQFINPKLFICLLPFSGCLRLAIVASKYTA